MDIVEEVKKLNLPAGKYAVVGSGAMAIRNIRPAHDIDLIVTKDIYKQLKASGWKEVHFPGTLRPWVLFNDPFDVSTSWSVGDYRPKPSELIGNADMIDGVAFVSLEVLLKWKKTCQRDKDLTDIKLIREYLKQSEAK